MLSKLLLSPDGAVGLYILKHDKLAETTQRMSTMLAGDGAPTPSGLMGPSHWNRKGELIEAALALENGQHAIQRV